MGARVRLSEIVEEVELQTDGASSYLNRETGEFLFLTDEELRAAEDDDVADECPEWQRDAIEQARDVLFGGSWVSLPSQYDIHEYRIMEGLCASIGDERVSESLCRAIRGRGAFRRFKDAIDRLGVADEWYSYRDEAFREIATRRCKANHIEYEDD
jgi:hypothetical protein